MSKDFVDQSFRRKWDKSEYAAKANSRRSGHADGEKKKEIPKSEMKSADSRTGEKEKLLQQLGKTQVVSGEDGLRKAGFYCEKCDRAFKDSNSWFEHINTTRHLQNEGRFVSQKRSTVSGVKSKLKQLKRKKFAADDEEFDVEERLRKLRQNDDERKRERKLQKKAEKLAKKEEKKKQQQQEEAQLDPQAAQMARLMGLPLSFGGGGQ